MLNKWTLCCYVKESFMSSLVRFHLFGIALTPYTSHMSILDYDFFCSCVKWGSLQLCSWSQKSLNCDINQPFDTWLLVWILYYMTFSHVFMHNLTLKCEKRLSERKRATLYSVKGWSWSMEQHETNTQVKYKCLKAVLKGLLCGFAVCQHTMETCSTWF